MQKTIVILAALIGLSSALLNGQQNDPPPGDPPPPGHPGRPHPPHPLVEALDLNHDGVIDADEIAKASESLAKLDKNGDGKLTPDEYLPPRPPYPPRPPRSGGAGGEPQNTTDPSAPNYVPPSGRDGGQPGPAGPGPRPHRSGNENSGGGQRGPGGPPPSPILDALDLNHDGVIDADEISKAPHSLLKLDKNGDGKLTPDEYRPPRPGGPDGNGPGGPGGGQSKTQGDGQGSPTRGGAPPRPPVEK